MTNERGEADLANIQVFSYVAADRSNGDRALRHTQVEEQKNREADGLRNCGCHSRSKYAKIANANEQEVTKNIQNAARSQPDHCIKGFALVAQIVVEYQGADHNGAGGQHPKAVVARIGKNGLGAAQKAEQRVKEEKSTHREDQTDANARKESSGNKARSAFGVLICQSLGNKRTRAVTKHKCDRLDDGLQSEQNAGCRLLTFAKSANKIGVCQIVNARNEHRYCRWNAKSHDQARHGGLGHFLILRGVVTHSRTCPFLRSFLQYTPFSQKQNKGERGNPQLPLTKFILNY